MELKLSHESICINEIVFDGMLEQSIELDYLLPDYCPSIFKVLKCKIAPKITSYRIMNGKLQVDGVAYIKVIYVSEESYKIRSVTQKQVFSKACELKEQYDRCIINVHPKCDYVNCRVINQHRLDIRGAISICATVSAPRRLDIISKASGLGVQIDHKKVTVLGEKLCASKEFTIKEELELAHGKPSICEILDNHATATITDHKLIQNKAVLKGEIMLHILYCTEDNQKPEIMEHTIPISQIVDAMGINEDYRCMMTFEITSTEISLKTDGDGECRCYDAEFCVCATIEANINDETHLINDIFSTGYEVQTETSRVRIEQLVSVLNETAVCKNTIRIPQNEICCVYDILCEFTNESAKYVNGCIEVCGNLNISVLALDCEDMPVMIEKSAPCEVRLDCKLCDSDVMFNPHVSIANISYNMLSGEELELRAELKICGCLYQYCYYSIVNEISVDESCKKQRKDDAVIRLYYASCGERVWDIAKRFNTSVDAILIENSLDCDVLSDKGMLLIPIMV